MIVFHGGDLRHLSFRHGVPRQVLPAAWRLQKAAYLQVWPSGWPASGVCMVNMFFFVSVQRNFEQKKHIFIYIYIIYISCVLPKIRKWLGTCSLSGSHESNCMYLCQDWKRDLHPVSLYETFGVMYDIDIVTWLMWSYQHPIAIRLSISIYIYYIQYINIYNLTSWFIDHCLFFKNWFNYLICSFTFTCANYTHFDLQE